MRLHNNLLPIFEPIWKLETIIKVKYLLDCLSPKFHFHVRVNNNHSEWHNRELLCIQKRIVHVFLHFFDGLAPITAPEGTCIKAQRAELKLHQFNIYGLVICN